MKLHAIEFILVIVGGLNMGLVGLGGFMNSNLNVLGMIFGSVPVLEQLVYVLIGLSAVGLVVSHKKDCRHCGAGGM